MIDYEALREYVEHREEEGFALTTFNTPTAVALLKRIAYLEETADRTSDEQR